MPNPVVPPDGHNEAGHHMNGIETEPVPSTSRRAPVPIDYRHHVVRLVLPHEVRNQLGQPPHDLAVDQSAEPYELMRAVLLTGPYHSPPGAEGCHSHQPLLLPLLPAPCKQTIVELGPDCPPQVIGFEEGERGRSVDTTAHRFAAIYSGGDLACSGQETGPDDQVF